MSLETRLYVVIKASVVEPFASFSDLANKVNEAAPPEFTYNRLDEKHVMQPASIVPYVSLIHFLGLLRSEDDGFYHSILHEEPNPEGAEVLVSLRAVAKLEEAGFSADSYEKAVRKMLRQPTVVLPSLREIYQALGLKLSELYFFQLCSLGGVRRHFGFTLVTRRVMLPTQAHS